MVKVYAGSVLKCDCAACSEFISCVRYGMTHDEALRAARRSAVIIAEGAGWYVSPHGATLDLCPAHKHLAVRK